MLLPIAIALTLVQLTGVVQRADPWVERVEILRRAQVSDTLDVIVVKASDKSGYWKLGLLLQNRSKADLVYLLAMEPSIDNCIPKVERVSATDVVGSCEGDHFARWPNWKFLFDPRAKALVNFYTYMPFSMDRILVKQDSAVFQGGNTETRLAVEYPGFRILAAEVAANPQKRSTIKIPLPHTTYDEFAAARPQRVKMGYVRAGTNIHDAVGPWQKDQDLIWFGKSFYDGEGESGVGGFGWFDPVTKQVKVYSPPELADWSVSAISASPADVWMGLVWAGETIATSGGLLRFDRTNGTISKVPLPDVVTAIDRVGDTVIAATSAGVSVVQDGQVRRYFVDRMSDGRLRVVEAN